MKKFFAGLTAVALAFGLCPFVGCDKEEVLDKMKGYGISDSISDLEISVESASVSIIQDEEFYVESNVKDLTVEDEGGCLRIVEEPNGKGSEESEIRIYIPDVTFSSVHADMGAGKFIVSCLRTYNLTMTLGAGESQFAELYVEDNTEIVGGVGKMTVLSGSLANLDWTMGVSTCSFTGKLVGISTIECGVGGCTLNLAGGKSEYTVELAVGLGGATVDGQKVSNGTMVGSGENFVDIVGGVGKVAVNFVAINDKVEDEL